MTKKVSFVDDLITAVPGEWVFNEEVSKSFDSHVRKSIPLYDEIQRVVVEMSEWFVRDGSVIYDIGSSTGETAALLYEKHKNKNIKIIGVEQSRSMLRVARKKCNVSNVEFLHRDVTEISEFLDADFITSLFTMQFLPMKKRRRVLQKIYRDLSEGGVFVMVEKIRAENSFFEDIWLEMYWDFKRVQGLSDDMVLQKSRSLRGVLVPLTLAENINLLNTVGFSNIDTFIKWFNFAGIIATKIPQPKLNKDVKSTESNKKFEKGRI
jgi:tRNA (cmo5U34)-methyltransferase